jgi:hypothetical protein
MKETRAWILVIGILAIAAWVSYSIVNSVRGLVNTVEDTTENALGPVGDITGGLATQVSQVLNPTPTILPNPISIIREVRTLARLETIQYSVEKVVTAESGDERLRFLFGEEMIFVAHGVVIAGVDLSKMDVDDLWWQGDMLSVRLPAAEIFMATLDNDKSYVYDRQRGLFTRGDIYLETETRQVAEDAVEQTALEDGILDLAQVNAESYLLRLLHTIGIDNVVFVQSSSE